jgi:cytochrome c oxidase cbb3-type subunit I/II
MEDPVQMSPGSLMPPYPWLLEQSIDMESTPSKIKAMRTFGVPYEEGYEEFANEDLMRQAEEIAEDLMNNGVPTEPDKEIIALIAYLQRLGTDINVQSASK